MSQFEYRNRNGAGLLIFIVNKSRTDLNILLFLCILAFILVKTFVMFGGS